jgi:hypothetical protein
MTQLGGSVRTSRIIHAHPLRTPPRPYPPRNTHTRTYTFIRTRTNPLPPPPPQAELLRQRPRPRPAGQLQQVSLQCSHVIHIWSCPKLRGTSYVTCINMVSLTRFCCIQIHAEETVQQHQQQSNRPGCHSRAIGRAPNHTRAV